MPKRFSLCAFLVAILSSACSTQIGPITVIDTPPSAQPTELSYQGAITLSIKSGQTLVGTNIGYNGKTSDGRALMTINGQPAPKSTADSVNFTGAPVAGTLLTLNTRVTSYDSSKVNLVGTVQITIKNPQVQPGEPAPDALTAFGIPVSYSVSRGEPIPGSLIQYLGATPEGAQFSNVGGYPYRQQFDSVVWNGRLRDKVSLRLDLRVLSFSDDSATLVGTAQVRFER